MDQLSNYKQRLLRKKVNVAQTNYELRSSDVESDIDSDEELSSEPGSEPSMDCPGYITDIESDEELVDETDVDSEESDMDEELQSETDSDEDDPNVDNSNDSDDTVAMLILEFYLRHNLTWVALDELLTLITSIVKMEAPVVPRSKYLFQKVLPKTEEPIYHYYCKQCSVYLGDEDKLIREFGSKFVKCQNCQLEFSLKSKTKVEFFVQLKLKHQLQNIVRKFKDELKPVVNNNESTTYDDVTSGKYYKSIKKNVPDLLSLTFNTDGVKIFKSRKKSSLWPLLMVVNEIPKEHRFKRENMILAGLWYGSDPDFSMYLKPFIDDLSDLNEKKFFVEVDNVQLHFTVCAIIFSTDTPAKAKVLHCLLFNGFYGCPYCFHPGTNLDEDSMRYPYLEKVENRTHELVLSDALKVLNMRAQGFKCTDVRGIKGPTPLFLLPQFNVVTGSAVDFLHCALHGITGKVDGLWFDSKHHYEKFYIGRPNQIIAVDNNISTIRPPKRFTRYPRSIDDRAFYKASEHLNWLLFYGAACIDGILPNVYLKHFQLFSSAIFMLNKDEISFKELDDAEKKLKQFLKEFPDLYGKNNEVFNVHLVSHIPESVRNCGPLWCYSNFPFEDMNGVLKNYVNGTSDVIKQIVSKYLLNAKLREKVGNVKGKLRKNLEKVGEVLLFGKAQLPSKEMKKKLSTIFSKEDIKNSRFYKSCSIKSNFIKCFGDNFKCDDSLLKTTSGEYHRVYHIYKLNENIFFCTKKIEVSKDKALYVEHLRTVLSEGVLQSLPAIEFGEKCLQVKTNKHLLISTFPNNVERY